MSAKTSKAPNMVLRPPMGKLMESQRFFQRLYVDFLGPYPRSRRGNVGIFIVLDHFSKFVCLKPVKKLSADIILDYMEKELFYTFGVPETVFSDNGSQFRSEKFKKLLNQFQIKHILSAVHAPQANASERVNRSIIAAIRSYIKPDQKDWDASLSQIECALRSAIHSAIGTTPYYMAFGQHMVLSGSTYSLLRRLELLEDRSLPLTRKDSLEIIRKRAGEVMERQYNKNKRLYDLRSTAIQYKEGDEVFRRNFRQSDFQTGYNAKLGPKFVKCRIRRKLGEANYEVEDLQGHLIGHYHAKDIRQ